jgi:orotate phosphoribosyltransferase
VDRSGGRTDVGVPFSALAAIDLPIWDPAECPLCAQQVPVVKPGSRPTPPSPSTHAG